MRYKLLGRSGLRVSELSLGTMTFGEEWGWGASKKDSKKIFDAFASAGGNFVDTANRYTEGTSEKYVGEFIAKDREHFVLGTKYTLYMRRDDPNACGNHRKNMIQSVEASLKRLGTDYIDLYWVHAWDFMTPVDEVMRALDDLVRAGKVLYVGISDTPAWIVSRANTIAELRGWTQFIALQVKYSLIERTIERELVPMALGLGLGVTPWGVVGGGVLTGKYNVKDRPSQGRAAQQGSVTDKGLEVAAEVIKVADDIGKTPSQVALNWVRQKSDSMIPIIGARTVGQVEDNLGCLDFTLTNKHVQALDDASKIELGFPHDFLARESIQDVIYGGTLTKINRGPGRGDRF